MNTDNVNATAASAQSAFERTLAITISAAVVGVLVIGVMGFMLGRSITKPLGEMQRAIIRTSTCLLYTSRCV